MPLLGSMQNRPLGSDDRRLSNAVADAADLEPDDIEWLIRRKDKWGRNLQRHLADKAAAYRLAVVALEQTRADLVELVQLGAWLSMFPQTGGQPATHQLPGPPDTVAGGPSFNEVRDALLRDAEELRGPVQPVSREYLRTMDRKQLVFERVDADGSVHPQVFERDTPAGWKVRDWLKQVSEW